MLSRDAAFLVFDILEYKRLDEVLDLQHLLLVSEALKGCVQMKVSVSDVTVADDDGSIANHLLGLLDKIIKVL